jgi:hypothetical protein
VRVRRLWSTTCIFDEGGARCWVAQQHEPAAHPSDMTCRVLKVASYAAWGTECMC